MKEYNRCQSQVLQRWEGWDVGQSCFKNSVLGKDCDVSKADQSKHSNQLSHRQTYLKRSMSHDRGHDQQRAATEKRSMSHDRGHDQQRAATEARRQPEASGAQEPQRDPPPPPGTPHPRNKARGEGAAPHYKTRCT